MWTINPKSTEIRHMDGLGITLENYGHYCALGLEYWNLDERGRGTPIAQEVFLWCEDQGMKWAPSERFNSLAYLTPTEAAAFKIRWF